MNIEKIKFTLSHGSDNDIIKLLDDIDIKVGKYILKELISVFSKINNFVIKDKIAIFFHELKDAVVLPILIDEINKPQNNGHIGTLIYACEAYDCTKYLNNFVNYVKSDNYEVAMNAVLVMSKMKGPFNLKELKEYFMDLKCELSKSDTNYENIYDAMRYIKSWASA